MSHPSPEACATCPAHHLGNLQKLGVDMAGHDYVVALAGNPNTGKSTVFNALTGLRQHTGNWPGKTVTRAEGALCHRRPPLQARRPAGHLLAALGQPRRRGGARLHPVRPARRDGHRRRRHDARAQPEPGAAGARDHQSRGGLPQPDGRSAAPRARRRSAPAGARSRRAGRADRGAPGRGPARADAGDRRGGQRRRRRHAAPRRPRARRRCSGRSRASARRCSGSYPQLPNSAWVALRLLDGDERIQAALRSGELGELHQPTDPRAPPPAAHGARCRRPPPRSIALASQLRWQVGTEFHQSLMEALYTEAARIADRAVTRAGGDRRFDLDRDHRPPGDQPRSGACR